MASKKNYLNGIFSEPNFEHFYTINKNIIPENFHGNLPNENDKKKEYIEKCLIKYNEIISQVKEFFDENVLHQYIDDFKFNVFFLMFIKDLCGKIECGINIDFCINFLINVYFVHKIFPPHEVSSKGETMTYFRGLYKDLHRSTLIINYNGINTVYTADQNPVANLLHFLDPTISNTINIRNNNGIYNSIRGKQIDIKTLALISNLIVQDSMITYISGAAKIFANDFLGIIINETQSVDNIVESGGVLFGNKLNKTDELNLTFDEHKNLLKYSVIRDRYLLFLYGDPMEPGKSFIIPFSFGASIDLIYNTKNKIIIKPLISDFYGKLIELKKINFKNSNKHRIKEQINKIFTRRNRRRNGITESKTSGNAGSAYNTPGSKTNGESMVSLQSQTNSMRNVSNNIKNLKTKLKLRNNIHTKTFNGIRVHGKKRNNYILPTHAAKTRNFNSYCTLLNGANTKNQKITILQELQGKILKDKKEKKPLFRSQTYYNSKQEMLEEIWVLINTIIKKLKKTS